MSQDLLIGKIALGPVSPHFSDHIKTFQQKNDDYQMSNITNTLIWRKADISNYKLHVCL
jgi:hypothetical protein